MASDRPQTPPRSTYSLIEDSVEEAESSENDSTQQQSSYIPHLFDLVYSATYTLRKTELHIPAIFLEAEAVDSSLLLGHGASFTASVQKIPQGPARVEIPGYLGQLPVVNSRPAPPRPSHVVYKTARVAFDKKGEPLPEHRRVMQSVLTELHALVNPELSEHPNIINFLGYAWGSNPFAPQFRLPALVVEYAEHGTLTQLLRRIQILHPDWKHLLCLDVARGLSALHASGLVHGDVKADNVLICRHRNRKYIAKVSDFGFSIVSATEADAIWMGGTVPWQAPEVKAGPIRLETAKQTDIYSFGLLAWLVSLNGLNPLSCITEIGTKDVDVEELKRTGRLLDIAKEGKWLINHMRAEYNAKAGRCIEPVVSEKLASEQPLPEISLQQQIQLSGAIRGELVQRLRDQMVQRLCFEFMQKKLARSLADLFESSLHTVPEERHLDVIVAILESDVGDMSGILPSPQAQIVQSATSPISNTVEIRDQASTAGGNVNANSNLATGANLSRLYSQTLWKEREHKVGLRSSNESDDGPRLLMLCACYMNGYGCKSNEDEALKFLRRSAERGNHIAQAFLRRIWSACRPQEKEIGVSYLELYAKAGSRPAFEELHKVSSPEQIYHVHRWLTETAAGVGADWLDRSEMLHGYTQSQWIDEGWLMEKVRTTDKPLSELIVNRRGDTVLHFTAMCGLWKSFKALILDYKMDVNLQNPLGETPLLAACRSGRGGVVIFCLQDFAADASIAANNGETPLHWLHRFSNENIEPMLKDMLVRGAKIEAATRGRIIHSRYPSSIDIDLKMPGTPLGWAVHENRSHIVRLLLKHGADPHALQNSAMRTPVDTSAFYHHHRCLEMIIEHLEKTGRVFTYGPMIRAAQISADKFSMILRGGADWLHRLHATFDIFREKTKLIDFQSIFEGSLLYAAVSNRHDELIDYMFKHDWLVDTINRPVGQAQRTPVLQAVRLARGSMVQKLIEHGADVGALAANPFEPQQRNWSALHIFAHEGHDRDLELVEELVEMGVPVDGTKKAVDNDAEKSLPDNIDALSLDPSSGTSNTTTTTNPSPDPVESPFTVALRHNAFPLATTLLSLRANPNHLSFSSGLFTSPYPLTPLGHLIIANARYSSARLTYLLNLPTTDFVVEPARGLSALHRCAMGHVGVVRRADQHQHQHQNQDQDRVVKSEEFDKDTNADIMYELLQKWNRREELDARCEIDGGRGATALDLAIRAKNPAIVKALVEAGATGDVEDTGTTGALEGYV
ncbi:MAG: hypothetical protein LQ350_006362 [Teloschistes chrysophthalmus]|nr:MAG: hypothetical protein LQ350_006362 [Niorma chrysophthalma]